MMNHFEAAQNILTVDEDGLYERLLANHRRQIEYQLSWYGRLKVAWLLARGK